MMYLLGVVFGVCVGFVAGWMVMRRRMRTTEYVPVRQHEHCEPGTKASKCGTATRRVLSDPSRTSLE